MTTNLPPGLVDGDREDEARSIAGWNREFWKDRNPDPGEVSATEALRRAGYGHRASSNPALTYMHDVYSLETGEVVATIDAHQAHDFARDAIAAEWQR